MAGVPGLTAGKYQTLRRIAVGGMGEIFLAREHGRLGFTRLVVIKRMLPQLARDRGIVQMFVDEARIVGHLHHPNICQILELAEEDGVPFLALEYVRGESLAAVWDRAAAAGRSVPLPITLRLLADTAQALHFAHDARDASGRPLYLVHRDISPHNVMVTVHGDAKLMDFGVARADNREHRTETGKIKGKIAYMSPEQLRGDHLDRRADVFAIGVMLWELTLGRRLFGGGGEVETLRKATACVVPRPSAIDAAYAPGLEAIVLRALAAEREARTATAGELARELLEQLAALGGAERVDVAALVCALFPEHCEPAEEEAPAVEVPESVREPPGRPTVPLRAEPGPDARATTPLRVEPAPEMRATTPPRAEPAPTAVREPPPEASRREPRPARRRWVLPVLVAIAAAAVAAIAVESRSPDDRIEPSPAAAVPAGERAAVAAAHSDAGSLDASQVAGAAPTVAPPPAERAAAPPPRRPTARAANRTRPARPSVAPPASPDLIDVPHGDFTKIK